MTERQPITVAGVDSCRGGWVVVERFGAMDASDGDADAGSGTLEGTVGYRAERIEDLTPLISRLRSGAVAALAIDMPIGLLDEQPRDCDVEARKVLGPRRSSVFPAPVRDTLVTENYEEACERSRRRSGKALSIQAYNLIPKIAEVDRLVRPEDQDRLVEAHPECAFTRLAGAPPADPKRTAAGMGHRRDLLSSWDRRLGLLIESDHGLPAIDLLDAAALVVTACHVVVGTENRLGHQRDGRGLLAQVVY